MLRKFSLFLCVAAVAYKTLLVDTICMGRSQGHCWCLSRSSSGCLHVHGMSSSSAVLPVEKQVLKVLARKMGYAGSRNIFLGNLSWESTIWARGRLAEPFWRWSWWLRRYCQAAPGGERSSGELGRWGSSSITSGWKGRDKVLSPFKKDEVASAEKQDYFSMWSLPA